MPLIPSSFKYFHYSFWCFRNIEKQLFVREIDGICETWLSWVPLVVKKKKKEKKRKTCLPMQTCKRGIPGLGRSPGGGHGNPFQYSCLENPMDTGDWWTTVHGVALGSERIGYNWATDTSTALSALLRPKQSPLFSVLENTALELVQV